MSIRELVKKSRSHRRFQENHPISRAQLEELVDLARLSPSGGNKQPLRFILSHTPEKNALIFPCLAWAGYLIDWDGPPEGERPAAYVIILGDHEVTDTFGCDHGIAAQSIMLGATEMGYNGCIVGSIRRDLLRKALGITDRYEILLALALGKSVETVAIETVGFDGNIRYWRDAANIHHVPKQPLSELIIG